MPVAARSKRQPISCEPCRSRKIRCSRDGIPCSTCVRRAASCNYVRWPAVTRPLSTEHGSRLSSQDDLAQRVRHLEQVVARFDGVPSPGAADDEVHEEAVPSVSINDDNIEPECGSQQLDGTLHVDGQGSVRFLPSSLQWHSSRLVLAECPAEQYPLGSTGRIFVEDIISALPAREYCAELMQVYFSSYASLFHVLHDPTFQQQYQRFERNSRDTPLAWIALLYAILGTAVHALPSDSPLLGLSRKSCSLDRIEELSSRYRSLAMKCLEQDHFLWKHNVTTLQALILLIYSINHSNGQTWTLLGLAHHLALSIGCQVDPSRFGLDVVQCEERRRCWAALKMLYTLQNTALGHVGISHAQFPSNCRGPADVDDESLLSGVMEDAVESPSVAVRPTQMTYLLFKFRLYDICSDICESVLTKRFINLESIRRFDSILQEEQKTWNLRFLCQESSEIVLQPHHLAHVNVLRSYASHLTLLLHHQVILRMDSNENYGRFQWSHLRCLEAARSALDIHAYVQDNPELAPFRWYNRSVGSFHAFHAAVVLVMLHQRGLGADCQNITVPSLQNCFTRMVNMSEMSPFCAKVAPLLQVLIRQAKSIDRPGGGVGGGSNMRLQAPGAVIGQPGCEDFRTSDQAQRFHTPTSLRSHHSYEHSANTGHDGERNESEEHDGNMVDWSSLFADLQPQQWLSPAVFPLDHWSAMISEPT